MKNISLDQNTEIAIYSALSIIFEYFRYITQLDIKKYIRINTYVNFV